MGRSLLCCVALLMLLGACDSKPPVVVDRPVAVLPYVPADMRTCPALPAVPGQTAQQNAAAVYVARLHQVAVTCKKKLGTVDGILTEAEKSAVDTVAAAP